MRYPKKEIISTILVPMIGVVAALIKADNWPYMIFIEAIFINIMLWLWVSNKPRAIWAIILFSSLAMGTSICFLYWTRSKAVLSPGPIQLEQKVKEEQTKFTNDSIATSKDDTLRALARYKLERMTISDKEWELYEWGFSDDDHDLDSYSSIIEFSIIYDRKTLDRIYKKQLAVYKLWANVPDKFSMITCTIRNTGDCPGIVYGLSSKIICKVSGHSMQGSISLDPLNKEFRLYPGRKLIFSKPILFEQGGIGTIRFSLTPSKGDINTGTTPIQILTSVYLLYYDGSDKKEAFLGYYLMPTTRDS